MSICEARDHKINVFIGSIIIVEGLIERIIYSFVGRRLKVVTHNNNHHETHEKGG